MERNIINVQLKNPATFPVQAQYIQKSLKSKGLQRKQPGISARINFCENKRAKALVDRIKYIEKQGFLTREKYISKTKTIDTVVYSETYQKSKIELFAKIINGFQPLTIFAKA